MLTDNFKRKIDYLRISVTDRCDLRCTYCMAEDVTFLPRQEVLSIEEIIKLTNIFNELGVKKFRLTGGEPLVRKNIMQLINNLGSEVGNSLEELTITTNGSQLSKMASKLYNAGVRRLNISLDTLNEEKFASITRWGKLEQVLSGLQEAKRVGLKIKINAVALKGVNDEELADIFAKNKIEERSNIDICKKICSILDNLKPHSIPQMILILADYQYKHAFVADHELNVVACLTEIMANVEFK